MSTLLSGRVRTTAINAAFFVLLSAGVLCSQKSHAQEGDCSACAVFPSVTVFHTIQTGPGNGIGFEAGNWKKETGSVSYFFGSSLVWQNGQSAAEKTGSKTAYKPISMSMYVKGQVALGNKLYATLTPGLQDLSFFTLRAGLQYVIPVSNRVGIGLEPNYSIFQNLMAFNTSVHVALR